MRQQELIEQFRHELPGLLTKDADFQKWFLKLSRKEFAPKRQTEDRFERMFAHLELMREESERKWAENKRQWAANERRWAKEKAESERKWEENKCQWAANERRWAEEKAENERRRAEEKAENERRRAEEKAENERKWAANERRWAEEKKEHKAAFDRMHEEIMTIATTHKSSIGALGSRWGIQSEQAFRNGLAAILEKTFGVKVENYQDFDDTGKVFGQPEQVELDVIVQNGALILCELKSSISKGELYIFKRKCEFYENRRGCKANRLLVISPMVDPYAFPVAKKLNIETYTHSLKVTL
ncbi:MAG: DUF3782 domain-containing protein [Gammaproteobacteria bacterium]|nr:DUF3782 domain-containing protein [Gammaproteobacteria bacterium]